MPEIFLLKTEKDASRACVKMAVLSGGKIVEKSATVTTERSEALLGIIISLERKGGY